MLRAVWGRTAATAAAAAPFTLVGRVVSNREMDKTAKVEVSRHVTHGKTKKVVRRRKVYLVHDEDNARLPGDIVRIASCRPLSRRKAFTIAEVINEAERFVDPATGAVTTPFTGIRRRPGT